MRVRTLGLLIASTLPELSTPDPEAVTWVSADLCVVYMTRGAPPARDIHVATRF